MTERKWTPKRGERVRCVDTLEYFQKGEVYEVAGGPKRGCTGFKVYEALGFAVLVPMKSFEPEGTR